VWVRPAHVAHVAQKKPVLDLQRGRARLGAVDATSRPAASRHALQVGDSPQPLAPTLTPSPNPNP